MNFSVFFSFLFAFSLCALRVQAASLEPKGSKIITFKNRSLSYRLCPSSFRFSRTTSSQKASQCTYCSGILLDDKTILTAAHCKKSNTKNHKNGHYLFIYYPSSHKKYSYRSQAPLMGTFSPKSTLYPSPRYIPKKELKKPQATTTPLNDLMIIKLLEESPIVLDKKITPLHFVKINDPWELLFFIRTENFPELYPELHSKELPNGHTEETLRFWSEGFGRKGQYGELQPYTRKKIALGKTISVKHIRHRGKEGTLLFFDQRGEHATCGGHSGSPGYYSDPITGQIKLLSIVSARQPKSSKAKKPCNPKYERAIHTWLSPSLREWVQGFLTAIPEWG